ncbi:hypothetical protein FQR65_LT08776 [Abscondita terminalis]|nr:hypothetical protein FQR65_LT08776 [Abscondita terminalis]
MARFLKRILLQKTFRRTIMTNPHGSIQIPNITLPEFIFQSFDKHPNETAVECSVTKKRYTFDEIRTKTRNFNTNLRKKLNLNRGDVIAVVLPNVPDYPVCVLGALEAGLIVTTINPSYVADEVSWQLKDAKAKAVITLGSNYSTVKAATDILKEHIPILTVKMEQNEGVPLGGINLDEFTETKAQIEDVRDQNPNDIILLPYSSGTTGLPKGVELTHMNIVSNVCQISSDLTDHLPTRTGEHVNVVPGILPWFHMYGSTMNLFKQLRQFSKLVSVPKFTPNRFIKLLEEYNPNILYLAPPTILFLTSNPSVTPKLLKRLTTIGSGAAPLTKSDEEKLTKKLERHVDILQGYGLTETSPTASVSTPQSVKKLDIQEAVA